MIRPRRRNVLSSDRWYYGIITGLQLRAAKSYKAKEAADGAADGDESNFLEVKATHGWKGDGGSS